VFTLQSERRGVGLSISYGGRQGWSVTEIAFPYLLIFSRATPTFGNVYIFEAQLKSLVTPLKHYNFS